jgi:hypothetical protein
MSQTFSAKGVTALPNSVLLRQLWDMLGAKLISGEEGTLLPKQGDWFQSWRDRSQIRIYHRQASTPFRLAVSIWTATVCYSWLPSRSISLV